MYIDDLIHSPGREISKFSEMQLQLYRNDVSLQDYFLPLMDSPLGTYRSRNHRPTDRIIKWGIRGASRMNQLRSRQKIKADVLFCPVPFFERKTENSFLIRSILGLAKTEAKVLCLMPEGVGVRRELEERLATLGRSRSVSFLDPEPPSDSLEGRLCSVNSRLRARNAFDRTVQILEPHGLAPDSQVETRFQRPAYFAEAWERLQDRLEFDSAIVRCHWNALCSPICRTARQRGKPVATFQEGVICESLNLPLTVSKFISFGRSSATFLKRANRGFFEAAAMPEPPVQYVYGGCLVDNVVDLSNQFENQTLLIVDASVTDSDFYGVRGQVDALLELARKLLLSVQPPRRVIIRPHPFWSNMDLEACKTLVREHPTRCELSHPAWALEDDLRRSSVVAGVYSGVLTVASACGLPTIFLSTEQGFQTVDLECFSPDQTLSPDAAFAEISKMLTDQSAYERAQAIALRNVREYYANGSNLDPSASFFENLLQPVNLA